MQTRDDKAATFNPEGVGLANGNLFGMPFTPEECAIVLVPVPWAATVSYHGGAENGPEAILKASPQLDFYYPDAPDAWKAGFSMIPSPGSVRRLSDTTREKAIELIGLLEGGMPDDSPTVQELRAEINDASARVTDFVFRTSKQWHAHGKIVGVVGGEHSCPLGLLQALAMNHPQFGILHIDAHADLRNAYMGLEQSHASIMFNILKITQVSELTQVGIRDYARSEAELVAGSGGRAVMYTDNTLKRRRFAGQPWDALCSEIISTLPQDVYISFDIDGLMPYLCPNTGTPVPGGLDFPEAIHLLRRLTESGRKIIGFDLCEVTPGPDGGDWDANVGARILWELCVQTARSQGLA